MIKKAFYFFHGKAILKYIMIFLLLLIGGLLFLLNSYKVDPVLKLKKKDNSNEIKKITDIADVLFDANKLDSACFYYNKAKNLCDPKINTVDYVYTLSCISESQMNQGNFIDSETSATETFPYLKYIKNPRYSWIVYNQLGINYTNSYNYNNAIVYFKKAIALKSSTWRKYTAINNLAAVYMNQHKFKEAQKVLLILSKLKRLSKYKTVDYCNYAFVIDNLGFCYFKLGNSTIALQYLREALKIRLEFKQPQSLILSYKHLSIFFEKTNLKLAREYAKKAYMEALKTNNAFDLMRTMSMLIKNSEGDELKKHSLSYIKIMDSINMERQKAKNQFSDIRYTSKKDKTENLKLKVQKVENELELERQKNRNIILYLIILFILGLLTFLYFHLTLKARKQKNEAIYKSEMQISKKLRDELANEVYYALSIAKNIDFEQKENKDQLLKNLDTIYSRTRTISKQNSIIITDEKYIVAFKEMISEFNTEGINILINGLGSIPWDRIEKNKKITIYRVLQELLLNMKKHSDASLVGINFKTTQKNIAVNYTDNGKGVDINKVNLKNGLYNIESRILNIKGIIDIESSPNKGFKVFIKFPM